MTWSVVPAGMENDPEYFIPPYDKDVELQPNFFCRARNVKREKYCRARSGQGTDHLGQGRCKNHGGSVPIINGRYSNITRASLGEHIDELELEEEKEKLDVMPEATYLRALTRELTEKYQEFFDGIIEWNRLEDEDAKASRRPPKRFDVPTLKDLGDIAKKAAEVVNMVHKQRSANAIALNDFYRLMTAMAETLANQVEKHLERSINSGAIEQELVDRMLAAIQAEWREIKLRA